MHGLASERVSINNLRPGSVLLGRVFGEPKVHLRDEVMAMLRSRCAPEYCFPGAQSLREPQAVSQWIRKKK